MLLALLLIDVALPSTVGAVDPRHNHGFGIIYFLTHVWFKQDYFFGASSFDLLGAATVRVIAFGILAAMRLLPRRRPVPSWVHLTTAGLQPLNASLITGGTGGGDTEEESPAAASRLSATAAGWAAFGLTACSWVHLTAKGAARLLQSGRKGEGDGFGMLPTPTTPPELEFWVCMTAAFILSECERHAFTAFSARLEADAAAIEPTASTSRTTTTTSPRASASSTSGKPKSAAETAADAAQELKKQYVKSTEPKDIKTIRIMLRMMAPDGHLLLVRMHTRMHARAHAHTHVHTHVYTCTCGMCIHRRDVHT